MNCWKVGRLGACQENQTTSIEQGTEIQQPSLISQECILIENIIRRLKTFRTLSQRYQNRCKRIGLRFNLIAAIYNLELENVH